MGKRVLAALALAVLGLLAAVVAWVWMILAVLAASSRGRILAIGFDQLANGLAGGDEDEVISSRCWRLRAQFPYAWLQPVIDGAFACIGDRDHCRTSFENELAKRQRELVA